MEKIQKAVKIELTEKLNKFFGTQSSGKLEIGLKEDQSFITEIDLFVSEFLKKELASDLRYRDYSFYSEEDFKELHFPSAIIDPIDGTRELVKGRPECAVSVALMKSNNLSDKENFAWIYNPFSGFSLDSKSIFVNSINKSTQKYLGLVSRSEYHKNYFSNYENDPQIEISPRGSIAFKLGLLASGACDFVVSLAPKNIWDIAAGTILCNQRSIYFFQDGKRILALDQVKYDGVLLWVPAGLEEKIIPFFNREKKQ